VDAHTILKHCHVLESKIDLIGVTILGQDTDKIQKLKDAENFHHEAWKKHASLAFDKAEEESLVKMITSADQRQTLAT